jgi:hypothetical protein
MSRFVRLSLLLCAVIAAGDLGAQAPRPRPRFGGAIEWRTQVGTVADSADRRTALALRILADGTLMPGLGWRAEGAYVQAQYDLTVETDKIPLTENGYELAGFLRLGRENGMKWLPYAVGGSILSLRGSCTLDNGFSYDSEVRCADATTIRVGWAAGAGVRFRGGLAGWDWFVESRMLGNVTSARGGQLFTIAFGAGK